MKTPTRKACMAWMLAALTALGLGQALGLFLTWEKPAAVSATSELEPMVITGTVIRQEQVVYGPFPAFWETELDAQRVYAGQTLFTLKNQNEEKALEVRLLSEATAASELPLPQRRENIHSAIAALQQADAQTELLMALVLGEGEISQDDLEAARTALAAGAAVSGTVTAPAGGIFVPVTDGLEEILSPENPEVNWADLPEAPADELALGRIITSDRWYLCCRVPEMVTGETELQAELLSGIFQQVTLQVEWVEETADGGCRVLLSCDECIAAVAKLRKIAVKFLPE